MTSQKIVRSRQRLVGYKIQIKLNNKKKKDKI